MKLITISAGAGGKMSGYPGQAGEPKPLRAEDVVQVRFQATKFREGYAQNEVDAFMDRVACALQARPSIAAAARQRRFRLIESEPGYPPGEVDGFLDRLAAQLGACRFRSVGRRGYDKGDVDRFLGQIRQSLQRTWLTVEDVENVRFHATKFRDGYDQDEVDDFLDEVVAELRRRDRQR